MWFNTLLHTGSLKRILYKQDLYFLALAREVGRRKPQEPCSSSFAFATGSCITLFSQSSVHVFLDCLPDPGATTSYSSRKALPDICLWLLWASKCHAISGELQDEKFVGYRQIQ